MMDNKEVAYLIIDWFNHIKRETGASDEAVAELVKAAAIARNAEGTKNV